MVSSEDLRPPRLPTHLEFCFGEKTRLPEPPWTKAVVTKIITDLRRSEIGRTNCGRQLIEFYNGVRAAY